MNRLAQLAVLVLVAVAIDLVKGSTMPEKRTKESILEDLHLEDKDEQLKLAQETAKFEHESAEFLLYTNGRLLCSDGGRFLNNKDDLKPMQVEDEVMADLFLANSPPFTRALSVEERTSAIDVFVEKFNLENPQGEQIKVVPSGIYIHNYLAAIPDGLIGDDAIVVVFNSHHFKENYYKAKLQLGITSQHGRNRCYFVGWHGKLYNVIEKDNFLEENLPVLKEFYENLLLPKIIATFFDGRSLEKQLKLWPGKRVTGTEQQEVVV